MQKDGKYHAAKTAESAASSGYKYEADTWSSWSKKDWEEGKGWEDKKPKGWNPSDEKAESRKEEEKDEKENTVPKKHEEYYENDWSSKRKNDWGWEKDAKSWSSNGKSWNVDEKKWSPAERTADRERSAEVALRPEGKWSPAAEVAAQPTPTSSTYDGTSTATATRDSANMPPVEDEKPDWEGWNDGAPERPAERPQAPKEPAVYQGLLRLGAKAALDTLKVYPKIGGSWTHCNR